MRAYKSNKKCYLAVGISKQKTYAEQYQWQAFLIVGTDIDLVVTNETICPDDALIYGSIQMKCLVYIKYKKYFLIVHLGWFGLNNSTKIINESPPFSYFHY